MGHIEVWTYLLTFDPNFLGHPSGCNSQSGVLWIKKVIVHIKDVESNYPPKKLTYLHPRHVWRRHGSCSQGGICSSLEGIPFDFEFVLLLMFFFPSKPTSWIRWRVWLLVSESASRYTLQNLHPSKVWQQTAPEKWWQRKTFAFPIGALCHRWGANY